MSNLEEDYSFFDENFDKGQEEEKKQESTAEPRIPMCYLYEPGVYRFRLYPENYNGVPRFLRKVWYNKLHGYTRVISGKDDKRIDELAQEYMDKGLTSKKNGAWLHKTQNQAIALAYLIKAPEKYRELEGKAVCMVFNWQHLTAWKSFRENFDIEEEGKTWKEFLHPMKEAPGIQMDVTKEAKGKSTNTNVNIKSTKNEYDLPPLTETLPDKVKFEGLDTLYVSTDAVLTDELYDEFKKYLDSQLAKLDQHRQDNQYEPPSDDEMGGGYVPKSRRNKEAVEED